MRKRISFGEGRGQICSIERTDTGQNLDLRVSFLWTTMPIVKLKIPAFFQLSNDDVLWLSESRVLFSGEDILRISAFLLFAGTVVALAS